MRKKKHKTQAKHVPKATILLVDDSESNLIILREKLDRLEFQTIAVHNGQQALEMAPELKPDLILLDVIMPGIDGFTTCRRLKELPETKDIPVIFMTGLTDMDEKLHGFNAGGVDYITKPFQLQEVVARVNIHLTIRRQQQQLQAQNTRFQEQNALIEEQHAQLQELSLRKDKFLSIVSNDLQQPFTGIFIQSERIKRHVQKQRYAELEQTADQLQTSVENYQNLLSNLLKWAQLQQGLLEYHPQATDINLIIAKNIALFKPKADQKRLHFTNTCEGRLTAVVDVAMFDTVVGNLISNAIQFTDAEGSITISAAENARHLMLSVSDTGHGIPEDKLQAIFNIDTKSHPSGISGEHGAGLGLILCKELLERHGGSIKVESAVEQGSTFHCFFPKPLTE